MRGWETILTWSRGRQAVAVAAAALLVLTGAAWLWLHRPPAPRPRALAQQAITWTPSSPQPVAAGPLHASPAPLPPVNGPRLVIPSIHVNAHIESVGVDSHGDMGVPTDPWDVAWYDAGPFPGAAGDAVLDGHLDWWTTGPAVFWRLGQLKPGDTITVVKQDGHKANFVVDRTDVYPYTAHPPGLFSSSGPALLSLITCAGSWDASHSTYQQRLVVTAQLVSLV